MKQYDITIVAYRTITVPAETEAGAIALARHNLCLMLGNSVLLGDKETEFHYQVSPGKELSDTITRGTSDIATKIRRPRTT